MVTWKDRARRQILLALLFGVAANAVYFALEFTRSLHGFAVKALGPAIDLVWHHLDANCYTRGLYCDVEVLAVNALLYTVCGFLVLMSVDVLRHQIRNGHDTDSS